MSARAERQNRRLSLGTVGALDSLELVAAPRPAVSANDVLIEVSAAALNFKEVLAALGMSQGQQGGDAHGGRGLHFGLECAGTVVACGDAVRDFAPGDAVMALGDSCFASYVSVPADRVAHMPRGWSFAAAATLPIAFLTARYALFRVGRLRRGERVLIHAATGGVGLAAVQLCRCAGAEIFASAGSEDKRAYLRSLDIPHVLDSRQLGFGDEVRARTGGRGVDVVLNSLSGEFVGKGVQALAPFGRFLELGKRDVYAEMPLNLRWLEKGISFSVIQFNADSPDLPELFVEVLAQCERGELQPLPYSIFPASEAAAAFTLMARAAHTGRVLLGFREDATAPRTTSCVEKSAPIAHSAYDLIDQTHALSVAEGIDAFAQALASGLSQVVVSTIPLSTRMGRAAEEKPAIAPAPMRTFPRPALSNSYVAPRGDLEQMLCQIWQSFLGIEPIGVEDSFESLGGDSLTAVPLLGKVRTQLQVRLPTYQLSDTPTIAQLAQAIAQKQREAISQHELPTTLVELHAPKAQKGAAQILFLIHPAGGHVHLYRDLAQALGDEQPLYALQAEGIDGKSEPLTSIEALAASYIQAMRIVQPQGPYAVGGASLGGAISYEIARQLSAAGQVVRFVALFDTPGPNYMPQLFKDEAEILTYLMHLEGAVETRVEDLRRLSLDEQYQRYYATSTIMKQLIPQIAKEQLRAFLHVWWVHGHALYRYAPAPISVPLVFFIARDKDGWNSPTPERAWMPLAQGGFDLHEVPGNHITMNRAPNVQFIADRLRQLMVSA